MVKYTETKLDRATFKLHDFGSIHEFNEYLEKAKQSPVMPGYTSSREFESGSKPWSGTNSWDEAVQLFESGWDEVAKKLAKTIKPQTKTVQANKTKPTYGVVGGQASVPRYLQGIPTSMIDRKQTPMKNKIIVVNKSISFPARIKPHEIVEEGIKSLQIIQALEGKGYRVKLNVCWAITSGQEILGMRLTIKKPEERLSLQKVAFPIAHPAMLRRIGFKWLETHPTMEKSFGGGYGMPAFEKLKSVVDSNEILLPQYISDVDKYIESLKF